MTDWLPLPASQLSDVELELADLARETIDATADAGPGGDGAPQPF